MRLSWGPYACEMTYPTRYVDASMVRRDVLTAAALGVSSAIMASLAVGSFSPFVERPAWMCALTSLVLAAPLALRRKAPSLAALLVMAVYITASELKLMEVTVSQVIVFLAVFSVGAWENDRRRAFVVRVLIVASVAVWLVVGAVRGYGSSDTRIYGVSAFLSWLGIQLAVNAGYFAGAWVFGNRSWDQAIERAQLVSAQSEIRAQQEQLTQQAISLERLRIARELHDVIAHHVSAMGIQAGAARMVLESDPQTASMALRAVEDSARAAISELGALVGFLRGDAPLTERAPTLADTGALIQAAREFGTVDFRIVGDPLELRPVQELTIYRVLQEALTNVRKHAGRDARADVRLRYGEDFVEVEVADDGDGLIGRTQGLGVGLTGMRERVEATGGTLHVGPRSRGGFVVRATMWVQGHSDESPADALARPVDSVATDS